MLGQFRFWVWAGLLGAAFAHADTGLEISALTHEDVFEWDSSKGAYIHSQQILKFEVPSSTGKRQVRRPIGAYLEEVQLSGSDGALTLTWYLLVYNPKLELKEPLHIRRKLKMSKQAWAQYEKGEIVDGVIDDSPEPDAVERLIKTLLVRHYQAVILPEVAHLEGAPAYYLPGSDLGTQVSGLSQRMVRMSKDRLWIRTSAKRVQL